ncbi:unnamed protein product [Didymodactylos carnosus]|uniref:Uncharacterized protein n=1 Tax=Didymodactylos carnosus TaxID=1234261 RepID=A0A813YXL7_9BILA|nr:unnamed protein product [Didymodactylos carnosus]CAF1132498.1 unnamed protein product [Didymodactylos carnosus]CAF3675014.1 unnamed protein product [Didymodactylos carnosus]CAF3917214.1 unnamed protein product [Didymodactylos carnosus]
MMSPKVLIALFLSLIIGFAYSSTYHQQQKEHHNGMSHASSSTQSQVHKNLDNLMFDDDESNHLIEKPSSKQPVPWSQSKTHATQFLNYDTPKWFMLAKQLQDDHYLPKRALTRNRYMKRKPAKPPMEVMNEIVNAIYLRR